MRRTILSLFLLSIGLAAVPAGAGVNYWSPIGPDGGTITVLTAAPRNSSLLYAATTGGVFKSADGGANWIRASRGLPRYDVVALAVAPSNPSVLYASTGFRISVSRNGGATWSDVPEQLELLYVLSLAVDPRNARWVWAGTQAGPVWSHDGGAHWNPVNTDFIAWVWDLLRSSDGGATWQPASSGLHATTVTSIAANPEHPGVLYAGMPGIGVPQDGRRRPELATRGRRPAG